MAYWGSSPQFSVGELSFNHFHLKWKPFSFRLGQGGCTSDPSRFFGSDFQCQSFRGTGKPSFLDFGNVGESWVSSMNIWGLSFGGLILFWVPKRMAKSLCLWKLRAETWTTQTFAKGTLSSERLCMVYPLAKVLFTNLTANPNYFPLCANNLHFEVQQSTLVFSPFSASTNRCIYLRGRRGQAAPTL